LGLPAAGIKEEDVKGTIGNIKGFTTNYHNPFFYYLQKGQYGSNSILLIAMLEILSEYGYYNHTKFFSKLKNITLKAKKDFFYSRSFSPSITSAIMSEQPTSSVSASCAYRSIPISLIYNDVNEILFLSKKQSTITHISPLSLAGSDFLCIVLHRLRNGDKNIREVIQKATNYINKYYKNIDPLDKKLRMVLQNKFSSHREAKKIIGTGSRVHMVIPLAIYYILQYADNFEKAILAGANSFRIDTAEEQKKLVTLTYVEEIIHCIGGNTDAIAALIGAILGCYYGYSKLPNKFLINLEDKNKALMMIKKIYSVVG
jgi:ADP-ribosylglycohydrolase